MSYQALYRKWRPQTFSDVVGQQAVTQTLKNAVKANKISHAYLFTGPRGTGKTTTAKLLAKAVNCPNQVDGEPCNHCSSCLGITAGTIGDVVEIDAASNNGVEEIRDIRDKVRYAPTEVKIKVYIIDEVHMLSQGAFNALLKTLEEPPVNTLFILATTEVHKIPATVISRTQRFDFKRLMPLTLRERMRFILKEEKIKSDEESLYLIARAANGGMRDALSLLDQVISFSNGDINEEITRQVTGAISVDEKIAYVQAIEENETSQALDGLRKMLEDGEEAGRWIEQMLFFLRDLLLAKEVGEEAKETIEESYPNAFYAFAEEMDLALIYQMMSEMKRVQEQLRYSSQPDIYLEIMTIQLSEGLLGTSSEEGVVPTSSKKVNEAVSALQEQVEYLTSQLRQQQTQQVQQENKQVDKINEKVEPEEKSFEPKYQLIYKTLSEATNDDREAINSVWSEVIKDLSKLEQALFAQSKPVAAGPNSFVVTFDYDVLSKKATSDPKIQEKIEGKLNRLLNHPYKMLMMTSEQWKKAREKYIKALHEGKKESLYSEQEKEEKPDELVQPMVDLFGQEAVDIVDD